jgi:hypothetical protein
MSRSLDVSRSESRRTLDSMNTMPAAGLVLLAVSVILLSSAWPLTKIALSLGSTPLWFAEGRMVLSALRSQQYWHGATRYGCFNEEIYPP